jgi:hypothetical protein
MAIKQREYLFSINDFKEPETIDGKRAIATLLVRLILMEPGKDPLHPTMGVNIRKYRYGLNNVEELRREVQYQIDTFLPCYPNASVEINVTPQKTCNIEITINDTVYIYDSSQAPIPIKLSDIESN